ncbi:unnamed protein product [Lactuca virosa]|uniref:Uncharacterized protein n=1 Tax=Lactuca virosa TaxID=75947 RepID=A0AAU9NNM2_9ASTR|nr:unnamed protein product [Lactuca virosa]
MPVSPKINFTADFILLPPTNLDPNQSDLYRRRSHLPDLHHFPLASNFIHAINFYNRFLTVNTSTNLTV